VVFVIIGPIQRSFGCNKIKWNKRNASRQDYVNAAINQLSYKSYAIVDIVVQYRGRRRSIACRETRRDWLQHRLMNSRWHSMMLMRWQDLCKSCASLIGRPVILFYYGAKWQNSCTIFAQELYFFFILLQMGEPLKRCSRRETF